MTIENLVIVGDIAGNFDSFRRLISQTTSGHWILSVGDCIDKGRDSSATLRMFMQSERFKLLLGNHELLLIKTIEELENAESIYDLSWGLHWLASGGVNTVDSFLHRRISFETLWDDLSDFRKSLKKEGVIEFLKLTPTFFYQPGLFVSHSPIGMKPFKKKIKDLSWDEKVVWAGYDFDQRQWWISNSTDRLVWADCPFKSLYATLATRRNPTPAGDNLHLFGHMSRWGYKPFCKKQKKEGRKIKKNKKK